MLNPLPAAVQTAWCKGKCLFTTQQNGLYLGKTRTMIRLSWFFSAPAGSDVAQRLSVLRD